MAHRAKLRACCLREPFIALLLVAFQTTLWAAPTTTSITLDGSLGQTAGNVAASGLHLFTISPTTVGKPAFTGANLFESFGAFNLGTGDTAAFTVNSGTHNIIARVTGGYSSTIDGTLASQVNLFFLNPAGVMFTANAHVDVTGSFVVGTANYAKLSDGNMFWADVNHPIADAGLTSAPISAFGFMTATPQPVSFVGSQITTQSGAGFDVIGGDISLDGATLLAPGGILTLFSAASTGEVPFSLATPASPPGTGYATAAFSQLGAINLTNQSQAEIDGNGGGSLVIRGGKITVDHSYVTSGNFGSAVGGSILVTADQLSITGGGFIAAECFTGADGSVTVNVGGALNISGADTAGNQSEIFDDAETSGAGGIVNVTAGSIDLNNGIIRTGTNGSGQGGIVNVTAGSMSMELDSRLSAITNGAGDAGAVNLTLTSGALTMSDTAGIIANTYTSGKGGDITVIAPQINMTGETLISSNSLFSAGNGGDVTVRTGSLSIQGSGSEPLGTLGVTALTSLSGSGNAGTVDVTAGTLSLNGGAVISSASTNFSSGEGGSVSVTTNQGQLNEGSVVTASSQETNAGTVQITAADSFTLAGGSSISTSGAQNGGSITLKIGQLLFLLDSNIQAYAGVFVPGQQAGVNPNISGGNINIDPEFVVLDNSLISANDLSGFGHDGNILNTANFFFTDDSILHATGTIETTAPDLDLAGSLAFLPANLESAATQLRERCDRAANHEFSTFIVVGRGGIENAPEELQSDFGLSLHLSAPGPGNAIVR